MKIISIVMFLALFCFSLLSMIFPQLNFMANEEVMPSWCWAVFNAGYIVAAYGFYKLSEKKKTKKDDEKEPK